MSTWQQTSAHWTINPSDIRAITSGGRRRSGKEVRHLRYFHEVELIQSPVLGGAPPGVSFASGSISSSAARRIVAQNAPASELVRPVLVSTTHFQRLLYDGQAQYSCREAVFFEDAARSTTSTGSLWKWIGPGERQQRKGATRSRPPIERIM